MEKKRVNGIYGEEKGRMVEYIVLKKREKSNIRVKQRKKNRIYGGENERKIEYMGKKKKDQIWEIWARKEILNMGEKGEED